MTREEAIKSLRSDNEVLKMLNTFPVLSKLLDKVLESPWRSVKEELPRFDIKEEWGEASKTVLFVDVMGDYYIGQYCIEHNEDGTDDTYWWDIEPDSASVANVTHWMPIPELPKEKEDAK